MFKVLVVDDEQYVRKGIINLIDWNSLSYTICGEAENGLEALKLIDSLQPDLVIVDIRMPLCDGLELIRRIRDLDKYQPEFIVVSGYHDFIYAQRALRYHVSDYILKPVNEEELIKALTKTASQLTEKQLLNLTNDKPLDNSLLDTLINGVQNENALAQISMQLHMPIEANYYYVLIECHDAKMNDLVYKQELIKQLNDHAKKMVEWTCLKFHQQAERLIGVVIYHHFDDISHDYNCIDEVWLHLKQWLELQINCETSLYVGELVNRLDDLPQSYKQSLEAINHKYAEFAKGIISYQNIKDKPLYYFDLPNELYSKLLLNVEEGNIAQLLELTEFIFTKFEKERYAPNAVQNSLTRMTISIINSIRQMNGNENNIAELNTALTWYKSYTHPLHTKQFFKRFFEVAAGYIFDLRGASAKGSIEKIKQYIDAHYTENINLKSIAAKFYLNSVYLGQLFKKNYGTYFNDYLLTLRIDLAKKLLRTTDLRMYEIAEQVGFQNADYFVTQFEKKEKLTPTDYRNLVMGKK